MQCTNRGRNSLLLITVLLLGLFSLMYLYTDGDASSAAPVESHIRAIFPVTEADRNLSAENAEVLALGGTEGDLVIRKGGRYLLRGELLGTLYIEAEDQHVHLILDNVSITGSSGPAISVLSAGKVFITSLAGTSNTLADSAVYGTDRTETACIYSTADLTFNGTGQLLITGLYEDAVYCRDTLKLLCSNLKVQSKRDCLRGNDGVLVQGRGIELEAERNGIRTTNAGPDERGDVEIRDAELSVIAGNYCVNSASDFAVQTSECFFKGIWGNYSVVGEVLIAEECLVNG